MKLDSEEKMGLLLGAIFIAIIIGFAYLLKLALG